MFKRKQDNSINVIYKSDEATRRAIDSLYTRKSDRNKALAAAIFISLFIGLALGWYGTVSNTFTQTRDNVVRIEVSEQLKAQPQSESK